jgi:AraC-like DNA-binding protein
MPFQKPLTRERLYPPYKLAALVRLMRDAGASPNEVLQGTGLDEHMLNDPACLTSIEHYLAACANAMRLSPDRSLSFRAGQRLHLADHGVYGLLLLSSVSVRDYFGLAARYHLLATPTVAIECIESGSGSLHLRVDAAMHEMPEDLRRHVVEQHAAQQVACLQDLLGADCRPTLACFMHPAPPHAALYGEYLGCPCLFDCERAQLHFSNEVLARRPRLANPLTAAMLQSTCDSLLDDLENSLGVAGKVYGALRQMCDPGAGMQAVASVLKMTDRTLRRRLADEGTSFSAISHHVRYCVATRHLKERGASIEQVAAITGFSDPANFRRAFIRWTQMTPAQFRRRAQSLAGM